MASGTTLVFDPTKTATTNAVTPPLAGGGLIAGAGSFISSATNLDNISVLADAVFFTGTINGSLVIQVTNSPLEADVNGTALWQTYDRVNGGGFVSGVASVVNSIVGGSNPGGYEFQRPTGFRRIRLGLVVASGSGTLQVLRTVKGGW